MGDYEKAKELGISADSICGLLSERYGDGQKYVCASEVGAQTGWGRRHVDFMAFHCWDSDSYMIEAFEIKIAKSDLKRELEDPSKHNVFFDDIDMFWIVAPDYVLEDIDIIPPKWGVMKVYYLKSEGRLCLKVARKPVALHDEQMRMRRLGRPFAASFCRAIEGQSQMKRTLYEKQRKLEEEMRKKVEAELANGAKVVPDWKYDDLMKCKQICEELDINFYYAGMTDVQKKMFKEAFNVSRSLGRLDSELRVASDAVKSIRSIVKGILKGSEIEGASEALAKSCRKLESGNGKIWCVTFVDYGDSVDGKARVLGLYRSMDAAHAAMKESAEQFMKEGGLEGQIFDDSASVGDTGDVGCEYRIDEVEILEER